MAQMSKAQAEFIARDLLKERSAKISDLKNERKKELTKWYKEKLPKEVLGFYENNKSFFRTTHSVTITGVGHTQHKSYDIEELPNGYSGWSPYVAVSNEKAEWLTDINNKIADQKAEYDKLDLDIQAALKNLTRKQLIEEFPEAAKYLEAKPSTALAINLTDLRKKILP